MDFCIINGYFSVWNFDGFWEIRLKIPAKFQTPETLQKTQSKGRKLKFHVFFGSSFSLF
jgi:hypothetical protein